MRLLLLFAVFWVYSAAQDEMEILVDLSICKDLDHCNFQGKCYNLGPDSDHFCLCNPEFTGESCNEKGTKITRLSIFFSFFRTAFPWSEFIFIAISLSSWRKCPFKKLNGIMKAETVMRAPKRHLTSNSTYIHLYARVRKILHIFHYFLDTEYM